MTATVSSEGAGEQRGEAARPGSPGSTHRPSTWSRRLIGGIRAGRRATSAAIVHPHPRPRSPRCGPGAHRPRSAGGSIQTRPASATRRVASSRTPASSLRSISGATISERGGVPLGGSTPRHQRVLEGLGCEEALRVLGEQEVDERLSFLRLVAAGQDPCSGGHDQRTGVARWYEVVLGSPDPILRRAAGAGSSG